MSNPVFHPAVILAATNLNDRDQLLPLAIRQATKSGARLVFLHVLVTSGAMVQMESAGLYTHNLSSARGEASETLKTWCEEAQRQGCSCESVIREGDIAQQVSAAIREFHADLLVLGIPHRTKLGKLLFGCVAEEVLRSVNLPVMTVGPEAHLLAETGDRKPAVVHATSLRGEASLPSAALAYQMASTLGAKLILLHVLSPIEDSKMMQKGLSIGTDAEVLYELRSLAAEVGDGAVEVETYALHGSPSIEILAKASESGANLIVLGAHRAAFEELARKRIVYDVWAHARCPVLTLHQPAENPAEFKEEHAEIHQ
jgi:nucleotide-binding universal stress UspA family protein